MEDTDNNKVRPPHQALHTTPLHTTSLHASGISPRSETLPRFVGSFLLYDATAHLGQMVEGTASNFTSNIPWRALWKVPCTLLLTPICHPLPFPGVRHSRRLSSSHRSHHQHTVRLRLLLLPPPPSMACLPHIHTHAEQRMISLSKHEG